MIINRALVKEVLVSTGAVATIILSIFLVLRSVGFLREAAQGSLPVDSVFVLLLLKMVTYLDVIIPLILFVAILMVLGRWYKDNEMTVISACGIGQQMLLKPLMVLVLIVGGLVTACSLYLSPLSSRVSEKIAFEYRNRNEVAGIVTGSFVETRRGRGVYFVESYNEQEDHYERVFVYNSAFDTEGVTVSDIAFRQVDEETGDQFLVLKNGTRYEGLAGQPDYRVIDFESYSVRLKNKVRKAPKLPIKAFRTTRLIKSSDPRLKAELQARLAKPIATAILALFALTYSTVTVRGGRTTNLLMAFLTYFSYFNALGVVSNFMKKETMSPDFGLWLVHAFFLILAIALFSRRCKGLPLMPRLFSRRQSTEAVNAS